MKRILVITLAYHPFEGGAEVAVRQVLRRLKGKAGFKVITSRFGNVPRKDKVGGVSVRRVGFGIPWLDKVVFLPLALLYSLAEDCDIVFSVLENQAALAGRIISWIKGTPLIINLQSGDSEQYIRKKLGFFNFLYNMVYSKKAKYAVLSKFLKRRAIRHGVEEKKITIIPNGVDSEHFQCSGEKRQKGLVVTTSRLALKNGIDDLIKAFKLVKERIPEARLVICGSGEDEKKLKKMTHELQLKNCVDFKGRIPHESLPGILCKAEVFARPSVSEGFGNSFIEALACGVPIVGTPVGGIPDFLEDEKTGLPSAVAARLLNKPFVVRFVGDAVWESARSSGWVDDSFDDFQELAEKIRAVCENKNLSSSLVSGGLKKANEYSWERAIVSTGGSIEEVSA